MTSLDGSLSKVWNKIILMPLKQTFCEKCRAGLQPLGPSLTIWTPDYYSPCSSLRWCWLHGMFVAAEGALWSEYRRRFEAASAF
ncbi:hypothetical protein FKM82_006160 [Ascaphus truei]